MSNQNGLPPPYQKSLIDEIDFKIVDQLYGAVSQISNFCFEIKKLCVATLFIVFTFIIKFTDDNLDSIIFKSSYCMIISFWFLDAVAYYYQVKLRGKMQIKLEELSNRHNNATTLKNVVELPRGCSSTKASNDIKGSVIDPKRIEGALFSRILNAGINHSMWIYLILITMSIASHVLYSIGWIK